MDNEHKQTLEAVETAIQMEKDGKQFYLEAADVCSNEVGKSLFNKLAAEEDIHLDRFTRIFESVRSEKGWPAVEINTPDMDNETIFSAAVNNIIATKGELDAIQEAMDMENKTVDYYTRQASVNPYESAKKFYSKLAGEERKHHQILLDYYEYVKDPAEWFTMKEHHSLDGG